MKRAKLAAALTCCMALCALTCVSTAAAKSNTVTFAPPQSIGTLPQSINRNGTIVGYWYDGANHASSFIRTLDGTIATFELPAAKETVTYAINSAGIATGYSK